MVSRIVLAWLVATRCLPGGRAGGASGQGSGPVDTLADERVGQIHSESRTPAGCCALAPACVRIIGFSDGGQVALYTALEPTRIDGLRAVCYGCRANRFSHSSRTMWSGRWQ